MILLLTYLIGYAICVPRMFNFFLKDLSCPPYDTEDVVFCLFFAFGIGLFYPLVFVSIMINRLIIQQFIETLNRNENGR